MKIDRASTGLVAAPGGKGVVSGATSVATPVPVGVVLAVIVISFFLQPVRAGYYICLFALYHILEEMSSRATAPTRRRVRQL